MPSKNDITPVSITEFDLAKDLRRKRTGGTTVYNTRTDVPTPTDKGVRYSRSLLFRTMAFALRSAKQFIMNYPKTAQYTGVYPALLNGGSGMAYNTWTELNFSTVLEHEGGGMADGSVQLWESGATTSWKYVAGRDEDVQVTTGMNFIYDNSNGQEYLELALFYTPRNGDEVFYSFFTAGATQDAKYPEYETYNVARLMLNGTLQINLRAGDSFKIKVRNRGKGMSAINDSYIIVWTGYVSIHTTKLRHKKQSY